MTTPTREASEVLAAAMKAAKDWAVHSTGAPRSAQSIEHDINDAVRPVLARHRIEAPASISPDPASEDDETISDFLMLVRQYGQAPDSDLAPDALALKAKVNAALASISPTPPAVGEGEVAPTAEVLAREILTEEWLSDILQDSFDMDWTAADGARAIMKALEVGLIVLPQSGGQIWNFATLRPSPDAIREALELARPIVEADLHAAIDQIDADWEGMSRTALEAIDAALATPEGRTTDKGGGK